MFTPAAPQIVQPSLPIVYAEPVEIEDFKFERDTDELLNLVNDHAKKMDDDKRKAREVRRNRARAAITASLIAAVTFFTAVGIHTCFIAIFG